MSANKECPECSGTGTIELLGGGGDYESYPCPKCYPEEYEKSMSAPDWTYDSSDAD